MTRESGSERVDLSKETREIPHGETIVRRFCHTNPNHFSVDEGNGELRITSGAIGIRDGESGVSVYCRGTLVDLGFSESDVAVPGYEGIASANVGAVAAASRFHVHADPWPSGEHEMPHIDSGHALMKPTEVMSKSGVKKELKRAAQQFQTVTVPDRDACLAVLKRAQH